MNGAAVPPLQSTTSSALMVVGSSSVEAVKFGGAAPNELGSPVTITGAPAVELVKSNVPAVDDILARIDAGSDEIERRDRAAAEGGQIERQSPRSPGR